MRKSKHQFPDIPFTKVSTKSKILFKIRSPISLDFNTLGLPSTRSAKISFRKG